MDGKQGGVSGSPFGGKRGTHMSQELGVFLRHLLLAVLILPTLGPASATDNAQVAEPSADEVTIEIGNTYPFGQTPAGASVSRSFRLVNKDTARPMRIYGFWIGQNLNRPEWGILEKPREDEWISPGGSAKLTILFIGSEPGAYKADISWYVEMKPVSEEDEDNFFMFKVTGEALEHQSPDK